MTYRSQIYRARLGEPNPFTTPGKAKVGDLAAAWGFAYTQDCSFGEAYQHISIIPLNYNRLITIDFAI